MQTNCSCPQGLCQQHSLVAQRSQGANWGVWGTALVGANWEANLPAQVAPLIDSSAHNAAALA